MARRRGIHFLVLALLLVNIPSATLADLAVQKRNSLPVAEGTDISIDEYEKWQAALSSTTAFVAPLKNAPAPAVYAKSYLLLDDQSAALLASRNPNVALPIASTTKMMTALVVRRYMKLDDVVTVTKEAAGINGSDIQLIANERISVQNLLKGLLIQSGNDAAIALAHHYAQAPDIQPFVTRMNEYAKELGLTQTVYGDPSGLDDERGRSTAFELAMIARTLLNDSVLRNIVTTPEETVNSVDASYIHELKNSNRLLQADTPYYLPNTLGIKTGFTPEAGHCLVSAYTINGRRVIGVVLNTNEFTVTASAAEMRKLLTWGEKYLTVTAY